MQFTLVLAIFAAFAAVGAAPTETNAQRMARGLPPLAPVKRTPVAGTQSLILSAGTLLTLRYFQLQSVAQSPRDELHVYPRPHTRSTFAFGYHFGLGQLDVKRVCRHPLSSSYHRMLICLMFRILSD